MTLKLRLAVMMVLLLVAVMALQYMLLQRETQQLADKLAEFSSGVERSTRTVVERTHELRFDTSPGRLESILARIQTDSFVLDAESPMTMAVFVTMDSTDHFERRLLSGRDSLELRRIGALDSPDFHMRHAWVEDDSTGRADIIQLELDSPSRRSSYRRTLIVGEMTHVPGDSGSIELRRVSGTLNDDTGTEFVTDLVVNLPLPGEVSSDSLYNSF